MTERSVFECDVSGERYGAKNDVVELEVVRRRNNGWDTYSETVHIAYDSIDFREPHGFERVFVERNEKEEEIVAAEISYRDYNHDEVKKFKERNDHMYSSWEEKFFQLIEEEILY